MEIWKDVVGYEGLYQVSNLGRVRSSYKGGRILKQMKCNNGYLKVNLCKNGKMKTFHIHRLVAEAFITNLCNLPQVNHKDENKENNFAGTPENDFTDGNLEWCDQKYNINYGTRIERISKPVKQFTKEWLFVREWLSAKEAGDELGIFSNNITACCKGNTLLKTYKGFIWRYKEEKEVV